MSPTADLPVTADLSDLPIGPETRKYLEGMQLGHIVDGEIVSSLSGETMPVISPMDGRELGRVAKGSPEDVDRAVAAARASFDDGRWRNLVPAEKERRLRRFAELVEGAADRFSDLDSLDAGLLKGYTAFVAQAAVSGIEYYAGWPTKIEGSIPAVRNDVACYVVKEPVGVVGIIVPWNGPAFVSIFVAAALAAGNSVVLKPAEQTPMSAVLIGELALAAGIPSGVVNVVHGLGEDVGACLVEHPGTDLICFTGSVETGRRIQAGAAPRVKRLSLELGGKSAHIVFADAELEPAMDTAATAVWSASGQVCTAGTRVLVQRPVYDAFVAGLQARTDGLRIGSPFDARTDVGPVVSDVQLEQISHYVDIGRSEGAMVVTGGSPRSAKGFYFEPTIFTGVSNQMRIAREEVFGPVMCVLPFETEEEALNIANDTDYGLAAGVWTGDVARAHRMYRNLRAGTVWVNTYGEVDPAVPYGGTKLSGHGRTLGAASIDELMQLKSVWMKVAR